LRQHLATCGQPVALLGGQLSHRPSDDIDMGAGGVAVL
jgi:hypothetical protein